MQLDHYDLDTAEGLAEWHDDLADTARDLVLLVMDYGRENDKSHALVEAALQVAVAERPS